MSVTVRDIAKKLNIGKSTVGYALNGGPKPVSKEVRELVLEAAKEMGYRPNETARSLAKGHTNMIGVVPFQLQKGALMSPFIRASLSALYDSAEDLGRHIVLFTGYDPKDPDAMRARSFEARVDGVVLIAPRVDHSILAFIAELEIPFAVIAGPLRGPGLHFDADNVLGVQQAVDHLVGLGHRRIATIAGTQDGGDARVRHEAFLEATQRHGCVLPGEYIEFGDFTSESGYEKAKRLLTLPRRPTAIFAANDQMALGVYRAARELGMQIPSDLSVVGFDDDELGQHVSPSLTTVRQPIQEMSEAALHAVIRLSEGMNSQNQVFATQLIVRASASSPKEDDPSCNVEPSRS